MIQDLRTPSKNMLGRIVRGIIIALSAFIAIRLAGFLTSRTPEIGPIIIAFIAASVSTAFAVCSEEVITFGIRKIQIIRKQLDPRSRFEGTWIFHAEPIDDRSIGYITIAYNANTDDYMYLGSSYNLKGELGATWICPRLDFDLNKDEVRFLTESRLVAADAQGQISRSFGHIQFEKRMFGRKNRYVRGKGFFCDYGTQFRKAHFIVDRLEASRVKTLIGKSEATTHEDLSELIRAIALDKKNRALPQNGNEPPTMGSV